MRRLMLLRHAKSSWDDEGARDYDRPLASRGREAVPLVGAYMRREKLLPDKVILSGSRRTRETWALVAAALPLVEDVQVDDRLYEATPPAIIAVIHECLEGAPRLLLIGHNPGFQSLARSLARSDRTKARHALDDKFPTAALCVLDFPFEDWADVFADTGTIERFVTPRSIGAMDADD